MYTETMDPYRFCGAFAALLALSAFFSAAETAFSSVNKIRLKHLAENGNAAANKKRGKRTQKAAEKALETALQFDRFLSTVLLGNNIVNILASSIATVFFTAYFGAGGVTAATAVTTVLVLIFAEITPKTLAKEAPERFALFFVYPVRALMTLFAPVTYLSARWKRIIVKFFQIRPGHKVTEAELLTFVKEVRKEGGINEGEEHMIQSAIAFDDLCANDILTPRVDITAVSAADSIASIEQCFYQSGYSRLPVYAGSIDNITGVLLLKDFAHRILKNQEPLESIIKPVVFTGASIKINRLLKNLQAQKTHLAVVLDEFGGTTGIVTMEDIVEELVGEIWDEHDEATENVIPLAGGSFRIRGNTPYKEFCETLGLTGTDADIDSSTAGGWVNEILGEIPQSGRRFLFSGYEITILKTRQNRVMELLARPLGSVD